LFSKNEFWASTQAQELDSSLSFFVSRLFIEYLPSVSQGSFAVKVLKAGLISLEQARQQAGPAAMDAVFVEVPVSLPS
jgi:hypothetical protein